MRPGSELSKRLADAPRDYELVSYTRLGDQIVGEQFASLPGTALWWVPGVPGQSSHAGAFLDKRIFLDIVLRLREEMPVTRGPATTLPARTATASATNGG
jgi:hypothetical protein